MPDPRVLPTIPEVAGTEAVPARGTSIGRFLVLDTLGSGGMGVVLAAYDPDLDRKVALKLLSGEAVPSGSEAGRESLVDEAQAMARLQHPNVVAVYEVGFVDDTCYLVMEHVEGRTLRAWARERTPGWREILAVILQAGAGLAAAHRAGLVHRDVKPDNVLVGDDGRARVTDFGLAYMDADTIAGTRAYMAPEQAAGDPVDARADQYSFCVMCWEALLGERPGADMRAPRGRAPAWLIRALTRGLATRPEDRWPSLDALLVALRPPARRWLGGATLLAAAATGALVFHFGWQRAATPEPCLGSAELLDGIWDARRREKLGTVFTTADGGYGADTWARVSKRLDDYATAWVDLHRATCRATLVEGRQSDTLMDLRMACLDRRRAVLGALTDLWAKDLNAQTLETAFDAASRLPPASDCADDRALTEGTAAPRDPAHAPLVAAGRHQLDRALALFLAGRFLDSRQIATGARVTSDASGWPDLRAEASYFEARAMAAADDPATEVHLVEASRLASAAGDNLLYARSLIDLVDTFAHGKQSADRALLIAALADGALTRIAGHPELQLRLQSVRGAALQLAGQLQAARAVLESGLAITTARFGREHRETVIALSRLAALAKLTDSPARARSLAEESVRMTRAVFGPGHPRVASALNILGGILVQNGDNEQAAVHYRECLAIWERVIGPDTTMVALALHNLGTAELELGHLDEAERLFLRALAIRERELGPEHLYVASTVRNLGLLRLRQGRHDEAIAYLERSLVIQTKVNGPTHVALAYSLDGLAEAFLGKGDLPRALEVQRRALELRAEALGVDHVLTLSASVGVARLLWKLGRCRDARPLLTTAIAGLEKAEHPQLADALGIAAECDLVEGQPARAATRVERGLVVSGTTPGLEGQRGLLYWTLARARWSLGQRKDAVAAAHRAAEDLGDDPTAPRERAAIAAWLAARDR